MYRFEVSDDGIYIIEDICGADVITGPFPTREFIHDAEQARIVYERTLRVIPMVEEVPDGQG